MKKQLLRFDEIGTKAKNKTRIFQVFSTHSDDFLGVIKWRNGWRCYVMSYEPNIDMSLSCSKELTNFIVFLEVERKSLGENGK